MHFSVLRQGPRLGILSFFNVFLSFLSVKEGGERAGSSSGLSLDWTPSSVFWYDWSEAMDRLTAPLGSICKQGWGEAIT